jgi:uncharacterized phage-associated protein
MFETKVTQMTAYLLNKSGGTMAYLKLIKLLYLADRESMRLYGTSISEDHMVSMPHGPVLSQTYDLIVGDYEDSGPWGQWIKGEADYKVSLKHGDLERPDYDELSNADLAILDQIYKQFGAMGRFQIRDYTHDHCLEWQDPHGSSYPIHPKSLFLAVGKSEEEAESLVANLREQQSLRDIHATIR